MGAKIGNLNKKSHLKLSTCKLFRSLRQERDWYGLRSMFFADQAMVFFLLAWSFNSPFDQSAMNLVHHTHFIYLLLHTHYSFWGKEENIVIHLKRWSVCDSLVNFVRGHLGEKFVCWGGGGSKVIFANFTEFIRFYPLDPSSFIIHDTLCNFFFTVIYHMSYLNNLKWGFF